MAKSNRICKTCGTEYYFCPVCGTNKPSWYKVYDSEACMNTYKALADYNFGHIDANQANEILKENGNIKIADEELKLIVSDIKSKANKKKAKVEEESIVKEDLNEK